MMNTEPIWNENGAKFTPIKTMDLFGQPLDTPNTDKRMSRIERLANEIGARVLYPLNDAVAGICVYLDDDAYECISYRQTERLLRTLKRRNGN